MSKVRFCIEEDNPYSFERLEKVLGRDFWYRDKNLRDALKKFIKFPDIENLIELLKFTPHAPVYDKEKLKSFKPNVLLITNEPGLNCEVIRSLYLRPAREVVEALYEHSGCIFGARTVLEEIIERFNRSMFSWLTLTSLRELGDKINGDSVKPIRNDCEILQNITSQTSINNQNNNQKLKKIAYCLKKISYWFPTDRQSIQTNLVDQWMEFIEREEPRVIHWDLLPYAQYGEEKNDINDEIREIIEEVEQKNFQNIRNEIVSKASYKQSLWYVKLLDKFLNAFKVVDINSSQTETGNENGSNFFILVVGNRIIKKYGSDNEEKDRREILGHLFTGLYKENPNIRNAIVIFRNKWCSCGNKYEGNLYFVKFDNFLSNNNQNFEYFDWEKFKSVLDTINNDVEERSKPPSRQNRNKFCSFYGGKNEIPCY